MTKGKRLNEAKKLLGLTYEDLGASVGVTGQAIKKAIERDNLRDLYLSIFEDKFGISKKRIETGEGEILISEEPKSSNSSNSAEILILEKARKTGAISQSEVDVIIKKLEQFSAMEKAYKESMENLERRLKLKV